MLKVLIAYDGSECADRALTDLKRAGLPSEAKALVLSVANPWKGVIDPVFVASCDDHLSTANAVEAAYRGKSKLQEQFPGWEIDHQFSSDLPFDGIAARVKSWKPDLVVVGSHGRSAVGRLLFGSVSHKILTHTHCNLRVARGRDKAGEGIEPLRILVAYDGSLEAQIAFETVLSRRWPKGTAVRLLTVVDIKVSLAFLNPSGPIRYWVSSEDENPVAWVDRMLADQKKRIEAKGLTAHVQAVNGEPKRALLREAESWGADAIFAGCRGLTGRERIIAGSVSTALATHAHCSVEIVHCPWGTSSCCENAGDEHRDTMSRFQKAEKGEKQ